MEIGDKVVNKILDIVIQTHGALGFSLFRLHSIKPNKEEDEYYAKYSYVPRGQKDRVYYKVKVNISDGKIKEFGEISKEKVFEDDN